MDLDRVSPRGVEVRRPLDPGLDRLAVEARIRDLLGRGQAQLGEEAVVEAGHRTRRAGGRVEHEQIADGDGRGDDEGEAGRIGRGAGAHDLVIAGRQGRRLAGGGIELHEVRAAALGGAGHDRPAVLRPHEDGRAGAARRALVAGEPAADVVVIVGGQVARLGAGRAIDHEQIGLVVGAGGAAVQDAAEGDAPAVGAERELADGPVHVDDAPGLPPGGRDRVEVAVGREIVRLLLAVRREEDLAAVGGPGDPVLVELARRHLFRHRQRRALGQRRYDPDVARTLAVQVAAPVEAVDGARDHPHVALPSHVRLAGLVLIRGRVLLRLLREVLLVGVGCEGDRGAVGRPFRRARPLGQIGEGSRLAATARDQVELGRLRLAVLLQDAREGDPLPVRGPAGGSVLGAARERAGRIAPVGRHDPHRGVVAVLLLVDRHPHEGHPLPIGRDLRLGDPHEPEQVRLRDGTWVRCGRGDGRSHQRGADQETDAHSDLPRSGLS